MTFLKHIVLIPAVILFLSPPACAGRVGVVYMSAIANPEWPVHVELFGASGTGAATGFRQYGWEPSEVTGFGDSILSAPDRINREGVVEITAWWVEIVTGRSFEASMTIDLDRFSRRRTSQIAIDIIGAFGKNGEFLIYTPINNADGRRIGVDELARLCGQRTPNEDARLADMVRWGRDRITRTRHPNPQGNVATTCPDPGF